MRQAMTMQILQGFLVAMVSAMFALAAGCGGDSGGGSAGGAFGTGSWTGAAGSWAGAAGTGSGGASAGVLTAGAWDDNRNYSTFESYLEYAPLQTKAPELFTQAEREQAYAASLQASTTPTELDIALVIDATGSMGDEIAWLRADFQGIVKELGTLYPGLQPRWSLISYRDVGEDYLVKTQTFTTKNEQVQAELNKLGGGGGGDYPEAVHAGLAAAAQLSWRKGSVARLVFWAADAPGHDEDAAKTAEAVRSLRDQDVHVYPVASSGVADRAEYEMRTTAQFTRGRYLFLTDDSGVGDSHAEPHLPCYFVTSLRDALVRMIDIEMSGQYREPAPNEIVRVVGGVSGGRCEASASTYYSY
ncbi:MAG: VWA domain-containing protein [Deltaproteobacteria bacterium]|nr:VWA domain-containing protein [Deltaproteobacteria bacterium]